MLLLASVLACEAGVDEAELEAEEELDEEFDEDEEIVDEDDFESELDVQAALGEMGCATSSNTDHVDLYGCDLLGGDSCSYTTPNTSYHDDYDSGEVCQPYITVRTQTAAMTGQVKLHHYATWIDPLPATKAECERARLELATYHYDDNGNFWTNNGSAVRAGTWTGSSCTIGTLSLNRTMKCDALGQCQDAQAVTARAYIGNAFWFPTSKRVHVGSYRL